MTATIHEAKTNLSELIQRARAGEVVTITSGRAKTPVAELKAVAPKVFKRLGARETPGFELGPGFWEPLSPEETGESDHDDALFRQ